MQVQTHFQIILDRSGSMASIADDIVGGFNTFLADQKALPGAATLTLVQFDCEDPFEVIHHNLPIAEVPLLTDKTFRPRGSTPLLDAIGRGINQLAGELADRPEESRPAGLVFVIVTDGAENASSEFRRDQISKLIETKTKTDNWKFVFLSADLSAMTEAHDLGMSQGSSLLFENSGRGSRMAFQALSARSADFRSGDRSNLDFDESERHRSDDPSRKKH
jgi:hypothetical protein